MRKGELRSAGAHSPAREGRGQVSKRSQSSSLVRSLQTGTRALGRPRPEPRGGRPAPSPAVCRSWRGGDSRVRGWRRQGRPHTRPAPQCRGAAAGPGPLAELAARAGGAQSLESRLEAAAERRGWRSGVTGEKTRLLRGERGRGGERLRVPLPERRWVEKVGVGKAGETHAPGPRRGRRGRRWPVSGPAGSRGAS